jgi:hypothetical protein
LDGSDKRLVKNELAKLLQAMVQICDTAQQPARCSRSKKSPARAGL